MTTDTNQLHQRLKHKFVLERLQELGFKESQTGKPLHELDYEEAKYELVIWTFKNIDAENENQRWF